MIKKIVKAGIEKLGYDIEIHRLPSPKKPGSNGISGVENISCTPVWPLPRAANAPSNDEIRQTFAKFGDGWHYAYEFEGKLSLEGNNYGIPFQTVDRPLKRFKHFMPYLVDACGGSLKGKRILDIACNSGFFSIQCALMGAEVIGFDGREELIEQANFIKNIIGIDNVEFKVMDFWSMNPEALSGKFDACLCLGLLYHLPKPIEALELLRTMSKGPILLNTQVHRSPHPEILLLWEKDDEGRMTIREGVVARPSKKAVELMLRHAGFSEWFEIPVDSKIAPKDYRQGRVASWIIKV